MNGFARVMEQELRMWWRLSSEAEGLIGLGMRGAELTEVLEEMEALALYSEWPAIEQKASAFLRAHSHNRTPTGPVCA